MPDVRLALCVLAAFAVTAGASAQTAAPTLAPFAPVIKQLGAVTVSDGRGAIDRAAAKGEGALAPAGLMASAPMVLLGAKDLPLQDAGATFSPKDERLHRWFHLDQCLRLRRTEPYPAETEETELRHQ